MWQELLTNLAMFGYRWIIPLKEFMFLLGSVLRIHSLVYTYTEKKTWYKLGWTECAIGEEQYGFRQSRGWMDQVFAVRPVCEKHPAQMGKMYSGRLWIWKRPMILTINMVYVADTKSVWSWRKIVESSAEVFMPIVGRVTGWEMMWVNDFRLMLD